jgi:uncharacterized protein GlcG (DUF336 family)
MAGPNIAHKPVLTLAQAREIIAAAEAEAIRNEWRVVIAVVDDGGHALALARLDGAQFGSVEIALAKARAAVAFKRPTRAWDEVLTGGRLAVLAMPGVLPAEGGVPLAIDGQIVGAIGVSGVTSPQDGQVAAAGVRALKG